MLDWEQVRRNNQAPDPPLTLREQAELDAIRKGWAERRAAEQHEAELARYGSFCARMEVAATKAGDERRAKDWGAARQNIGKGLWSVGRTVASEPSVTAFQNLRTNLLYEGRTVRLDD
jgi:hypothetical protein